MTYLLYVNFTWRMPLASLITVAALFAFAPGASGAPSADPVVGVLTAGGQRQWIDCEGSGSPTLVISSGLGADSSMWSRVLPKLRTMTRTCIYDRPGLGKSPKRNGAKGTDAGEHAKELKSLLIAAGESGPFILMGHSYAGLIVRAFAAQKPVEVAGMLLLGAVYPGIHRTFLSSYKSPWHEGGTSIDMAASERATNGGPDLGSTPLIVITAGYPSNGTSWADRKWNAEQDAAAKLSTNSLHLVAKKSGHVIQQQQPAIVIAGVRRLLEAARTSTPLVATRR